MTQHYRVGSDRPDDPRLGDDVYCYDSAESALMAWHGRVTVALDSIVDDGKFLEVDTARSLVTVSDVEGHEGATVAVGKTCYYIEKCGTCGDTGAECVGECVELNG